MTLGFPTLRWIGQSLWPRFTTRSQQQMLLRLIATAAEQRLPLKPLVEAQEKDERGRQKGRLRKLVKALNNGEALPDALEQVVGVLNDEDVLAIRFGYQSGAVAAAARERLEAEPLVTPKARVGIGKLFLYLGLLVLVGVPASIFLQVYIVPQFVYIFDELHLSPPVWIDLLISVGSTLTRFWWLPTIAIMALVWVLVSDRSRQFLRRAFAGGIFHPLRQWRSAATLDELSVATAAGRPLPGVISTLARYHYDPHLRRKLLYVRNELEQGAELWPTLVETQFLSPSEVEALETADSLGNRAWVLKQIAKLRKSHINWKLERLVALGVLLLIFALGAFVILHALGIFLSLSELITGLS